MPTLQPLLATQHRATRFVAGGLPSDTDVRATWLPRRDKTARVTVQGHVGQTGTLALELTLDVAGPVQVELSVAATGAPLAELHAYVAPAGVARLRPLRCDFHVHSDGSDGQNSVQDMVLRGRELGLDVLAITDHNRYDSSMRAALLAQELGLGLLTLPGEEISASGWHLLSLGASAGIGVGGGRNTDEGLRPTIAQVHALGGRAFLAHPYWTYHGAHHLRSALYDEVLAANVLDGIELLGDVDWADNVRSVARWSALEPGKRPPILGNSDTHSVDHTYGRTFTLLWAEATTQDAVFDAIAARRSVACAVLPGGDPARRLWVAGELEWVDLALFLDEHYLTRHAELCRAEVATARACVDGRASPGDLVEARSAVEHWQRQLHSPG